MKGPMIALVHFVEQTEKITDRVEASAKSFRCNYTVQIASRSFLYAISNLEEVVEAPIPFQ